MDVSIHLRYPDNHDAARREASWYDGLSYAIVQFHNIHPHHARGLVGMMGGHMQGAAAPC